MNIKLVPVQMVYKVFHGTLQVLQNSLKLSQMSYDRGAWRHPEIVL